MGIIYGDTNTSPGLIYEPKRKVSHKLFSSCGPTGGSFIMSESNALHVLDLFDRFRVLIDSLETPEDVYECIDIIHKIKEDNEMAHLFEDDLHRKVLTLIASGLDYSSCKIMAEIALKTRDIDFHRWYA